jgi:type IV secretory pathway VirB9-like protein
MQNTSDSLWQGASWLPYSPPPCRVRRIRARHDLQGGQGHRAFGNLARQRRCVTRGADGKVIYLFGETQPSVVCSPLQVCDIELQGGEVVRDVLVGDTVRWKVEPATSGAAGGQAIHLVVKPAEAGLVTSMVVTTSRRTYHIQLKSHPSQYMARVGFEYPQDVSSKLADINARLETRFARRVPRQTG